jgi:hypothetical protein
MIPSDSSLSLYWLEFELEDDFITSFQTYIINLKKNIIKKSIPIQRNLNEIYLSVYGRYIL